MACSKITDEELLALYNEGLTNRQIADHLHVSQAAVHYRIEKLELVNNYCTEESVDSEMVRLLHMRGLTTVGIALMLQTNVKIITEHLRKLGLQDNYYRLREIVQLDRGNTDEIQ
jgi:predicted transcriptional regulator